MSLITPSKPPRYYSTPQSITWTADPTVTTISSNINGIPPAISEYIAYDQLNPPNPFLATTQDGKGNVVYDGGFPKIYNRHILGSIPTSFNELPGSYKFIHNALHFVANPEKTANGNVDILVIGDQVLPNSYSVKDATGNSGFLKSWEVIADIAGFNLTVKDRLDWGGVINPTLGELEQYCLVVVMGALGGDSRDNITSSAVANFTTYRQNGNGIILITDHGPDVTSLQEAKDTAGGFFDMVNQIAVNFGAYFTGDYDRTPVSVGFLRNNYGDHPLYNNLDDSEDIHAGGSESRVVVTEVDTYNPSNIPPTDIIEGGRYEINFLMILNDGTVETERFVYTVTDGEFVFIERTNGELADNHVLTTHRKLSDFGIAVTDQTQGTLQGILYKNQIPMGHFTTDSTGTSYEWLVPGMGGFPLHNNDRLEIAVKVPITYTTDVDVLTQHIELTDFNLAWTMNAIGQNDLAGLTTIELKKALNNYVRLHHGVSETSVVSYASVHQSLIGEMKGSAYPTLEFPITDTQSELTTLVDGLSGEVGFAYSLEGDTIAYRLDSQWVVNSQASIADFLSGPRTLISTYNGKTYHFDGTAVST